MRNILLIAKREYLEQIRGRAFRFSTVLVPLLILFMLGALSMTTRNIGKGARIAVAADHPELAAAIRDNLTADDKSNLRVETVAPFTENQRQDLLLRAGNKQLNGVLVVEDSDSAAPRVTYYSKSSTGVQSTAQLEEAVNAGLLRLRLARQGLTPEQTAALSKAVHVKKLEIDTLGKTTKSQGMMPFYKAMIMTFLMTMPILLYGMDMARSIVEEKNSRIFEVMLSVTRAEDLLTGKLLGVGAVGLTQIAIWVAAAAVMSGSALMGAVLSGDVKIHFSLLEALLFPVYFLLGFLLYSALFSGLAATCETSQDLQMYLSLAVVPAWTGFLILPYLLSNPNSPWIVAASLFPPTAPLVMAPRIGLLAAPFPYWQVALSIGLLVLSIWVVLWFSSRLYRVGILMYGKRATLPELVRWLRAS
jgi:ABC-2 type transport system permease protein